MRLAEIEVGGRYIAKVSGVLTTVRVLATREVAPWQRDGRWQTKIDVVNERTGRRTTFASAAKLRRRVDKPVPTPATPPAASTANGAATTPSAEVQP